MSQFLKSLFISTYPVLCLIGVAIALDQLLYGNYSSAVGLLLVSVPMLVFLATLFLTDIARTDADLLPYSVLVGFGTLLLSYTSFFGEAEQIVGFGFFLAIGWLLYLRWYSVFKGRSVSAIKQGNHLSDFTLEDENGHLISSGSLLDKKSIWLFYRGNWCPLCMTQIKELVAAYKILEAQGIQTILISPQPHKMTQKLAQKYRVDFKFMVDKDNAVAKQLGLFSKNGLPMGFQVLGYDSDTVMPTVILTDDDGTIIHSDLSANYRVRPEPETLINYFN